MADQPKQTIWINTRFLSPAILVFYSTIIFLICLPLLPVDVKYPMTIEAFFFWLLCFISFFIGTLIGCGKKSSMLLRQYHHSNNTKKAKNLVLMLVTIGFIGIIMLFVDRYLIRGVSLSANSMENREMLNDNKASLLSMIAAATSAFGTLSYILIWITEVNQIVINRWLKLLALLSPLLVLIFSIQMGSRSLMLVVLLVYLFAWLFVLRLQGRKIQFQHKLMVVIAFLGLAIISAVMMVSRVELMGIDIFYSFINSAYAYTLLPSPFLIDIIQSNQAIGEILSGLFSLVQYVFHGIYEFSLLFNNYQGEHELGNRVFWLPIKILSISTGGWIETSEAVHAGERYGIFTTFVGPIFIDFGWFSPVFLVLYGILISLPYRLLQRGFIEWLPAVLLVATNSVLWPVVNIFISATGTYLLVAALTIGFIGKRLRI